MDGQQIDLANRIKVKAFPDLPRWIYRKFPSELLRLYNNGIHFDSIPQPLSSHWMPTRPGYGARLVLNSKVITRMNHGKNCS